MLIIKVNTTPRPFVNILWANLFFITSVFRCIKILFILHPTLIIKIPIMTILHRHLPHTNFSELSNSFQRLNISSFHAHKPIMILNKAHILSSLAYINAQPTTTPPPWLKFVLTPNKFVKHSLNNIRIPYINSKIKNNVYMYIIFSIP